MGVFAGVPVLRGEQMPADVDRPLLTYCDDATGERTELSAAQLAGWASRTAGLLHEGCGIDAGGRVAVLLPPHWQTAAVLLGCWSAGLSVVLTCPPGGGAEPVAEVAFVAAGRTDEVTVGDRYALGLHPLGLPLREVPPGYQDFSVEVRAFGDRFGGVRVRDQGALCADAARRATELGIGAGDRVLVDAASHPDPVDWLLAPLAAGASVVLCHACDKAARERIRREEKVTR